MPTTLETLNALFNLQQVDTQIGRAKRTQSGLDSGAAAQQEAQAARDQAQACRTEHHRLAGSLKDSELKLASVETKRKSYQQKLYQGTVTNAKELANIEKEIEALGRQRSDLDGRILELMEETEAAQEALTLADAQAQQAEAHRTEVSTTYRTQHERLQLEIAALGQQREASLASVEDNAALKRYEDIRAKAGGVGIAKIEGNTCGGCHMTLPSGLIKSVKELAQMQTCENCGRLLLP